jgi:CRP/FNR family transcriptional regulator, anaerobic regulatory protein
MCIRKECSQPPSTKSETCRFPDRGICSGLATDLLERLNAIVRRRIVPADQYIFKHGEEVNSFATLASGVVKLTKTTAAGERQVIALMYSQEFLGYTFGDHHHFSAVAATTAELRSYPCQPFRRLQAQFPQLERRILELSLRDLDICREWTLMLGRKSSHERVAGLFSIMARRARESGSMPSGHNEVQFRLPLARAELADCLGLTLETVSRNITRLKREGMIELRTSREIIVPSIALLGAAAKMDS